MDATRLLPPHSIELEQSVLGSLLLDPDAVAKVAGLLDEGDFYREAHAKIFKAVLSLFNAGLRVDIMTVSDELERADGLEKVGGASYLTLLGTVPPTAAYVEGYAQRLKKYTTRRELIGAAGKIAGLGYDGEHTDPLSEAIGLLLEVAPAEAKRLLMARELAERRKDDIEAWLEGKEKGVSSGFPDLDRCIGGLRPGNLYILAGRPSMGKTALALQIALEVAKGRSGAPLVFSAEMGDIAILERWACIEARMSQDEFTRLPLKRRREVVETVLGFQWGLCDLAGITTQQIRAEVARLVMQVPVALVIFDYIELAGDLAEESEVLRISRIGKGLKAIAKDYDVPVLACSQLNRQVEMRTSRVPKLSDLRWSGSLEQDADVVMLIYRDEYYARQDGRAVEVGKENTADLIVAKQRTGPTGMVKLRFDGTSGRFDNLAEELRF